MAQTHTLALSVLLLAGCSGQKLPPDFKFGAATSAFQIEGSWNTDGKGESIWDRFAHTHKEAIADGSNADVAADSYTLWRKDIDAASQLGLDFYRFSIAWTRILPSGFTNKVSRAGVNYYNGIIDELLRRGIQPLVTMYQFDMPMSIQNLGGWTNPLIVDWFADYARVLFTLFGDRVKTWLTMNEVGVICDLIYNTGNQAPGIKDTQFAPFLCNKYLLLAHAKAYRLYEKEFKQKYGGRLSFTHNILWLEPYEYPRDKELAELGAEYMIGRYSHPIFSKEGGWPPRIEKLMLEYSLKQGYNSSRLPSFTEEEKKMLRGSADFYGLNYYTTHVIRPAKPGESGVWFINGSPELGAMLEIPSEARLSASEIMPVYPKGLRRTLSYLKKTYGDIEVLITENGYAGRPETYDKVRVNYIRDHLKQVSLAIYQDKVNVTGYSHWSLFDNFEWISGYSVAFGLFAMNQKDHKKTRSPRLSSLYYACVIKTHNITVSEECIEKNKDKLHFEKYASFEHLHNNSYRHLSNITVIFLVILSSIAFKT